MSCNTLHRLVELMQKDRLEFVSAESRLQPGTPGFEGSRSPVLPGSGCARHRPGVGEGHVLHAVRHFLSPDGWPGDVVGAGEQQGRTVTLCSSATALGRSNTPNIAGQVDRGRSDILVALAVEHQSCPGLARARRSNMIDIRDIEIVADEAGHRGLVQQASEALHLVGRLAARRRAHRDQAIGRGPSVRPPCAPRRRRPSRRPRD